MLTIGYLVTEGVEEVIVTTGDGNQVLRACARYRLPSVIGFGLIHALEPLNLPPMPVGATRGD